MKKEKNLLYSLPILIYAIIYFVVIVRFLPRFVPLLNCLFIGGLTFLNYKLYKLPEKKTDKKEKRVHNKTIIYIAIGIFIYFTLIYLLGMITGYRMSAYARNIFKILKRAIFPFITISVLEIYRYISINKCDEKKNYIIETILIILFDVVIHYYRLDGTLTGLFIFSSVVILPIILKNILLNYVSKNIGIKPCLLYVIPLGIYSYFVPVYPDLGNYLTCIVNMTLPSFIYIYLGRMMAEENKVEQLEDDEKKKQRKTIFKIVRAILDVILIFIFTIFISLISGYFPYQLVGVDTSYISPTIKRGDAIILYKNLSFDEYDTGNIIAYRSGKKIIIDIVAKNELDDLGYHHLYVKKEIKDGKVVKYREITEDNLIGIYNNFKVNKIAYPTIKFKEIIKGDVNEKK